MKKWLTFLLAGFMILTACGNPIPDTPSSEESVKENIGGPYLTLVSVGKPYTTNVEPNENYLDCYSQQLTDGEKTSNIGAHYSDSRMIGYTANCTIQVDLGEEDGKRIKKIVARSLEMHQDGVALAASVRFSASNDGKKFTTLGTRPFKETGDLTVSEVFLELGEATDYRYIRIQIYNGSGVFFFTDEVEVYADIPPKEQSDNVAAVYATENIDRNAWKSLSKGVAVNPIDTKVVTVGKKYTLNNCTFDERAPKTDTLVLTDGERTSQYFSDPVWLGMVADGEKSPEITLDLENKYDNICSFKVYTCGGGVNVDLPTYIDIYASNGGDYTFVGRMYAPKEGRSVAYTLLLLEYIEAKNVRFVFPKEVGNYWVEEIQVIAGYNEEQSDVLYPPVYYPKVTEDIYWDASEPDYKTEQNLLLGLKQQVSALFYADVDKHAKESPADFPYLTDGNLASDLYCYSGEWFYTGGGQGIEFFYDLGKLSTLTSVNISLLEQTDWGISRPKYISVFLSDDGNYWYEVAEYTRGDTALNKNQTRISLPFEFDKAYAARFVRFRFEGAAMFFDEFQAFGTKEVKASAVRLANSGMNAVPYFTNTEDAQFASTENTPIKASEIMLVYGDRNKREDLLPMVAYLDEEGNIKDTFMDGFIYCSHYNLPSGALGHLANYKQDWEYVFDNDFNGESGFDALDEVVGQVKEALGLTDYKVQVYSTFLTLHDTVSDFGDVDGDGVTEDATTADGRAKIFDWYINKTLDEFESRNYKNIEHNGFYWLNEAVNWEKDDSHVIAECGERVHAAGSNFLWVPYYSANRFFTGYELGFDMISMQPNVVFSTDAPLWRFDSAIEMTMPRKMTVELEHSYQCLGDPSFARSYMLYLYYGVKTGYMNAIHVYYDDIANFALMGNSNNPLCRMQYDATYNFAKHTLETTPAKREAFKLKGKKDSIIEGNLNESDALQLFTLTSAPEHGYVTFNSDGTFRYFPEKGFTGADSFTYTYNEFLGESEKCIVEITVE